MAAMMATTAIANPVAPGDVGFVKSILTPEETETFSEEVLSDVPGEYGSSMPRLSIMSRDKSFYLGIGGSVKVTAGYDFGHPMDNPNEFFTSAIPNSVRKGDGGLLQFSAQQSALYLNFVGLPGTDNQFSAFIGANLLGDDYAPTLQYAFLKYRGFTAGYDKTFFSDTNAAPPTIDYEGPNSYTAINTLTLNYQFSFGKEKRWSAGIGVEVPNLSATEREGFTYTVNQRVPDIPAFIKYSWNGGDSWVRGAAMLRNMMYRDVLEDRNIDKVGWGVQLSGVMALAPRLTAFYQGVYGKGIASYIQDLTDCGMDMLPSLSDEYHMNLTKTWGAFVGLQYDFSDDVFCSACYSHVRNYAGDSELPMGDDQYRYAQYVDANLFWNINPYMQAGIEYIYGRRVNFDFTQAHDNRLQLAFQVSF